MRRLIIWAPLAGFVIFFIVVAFGLISPSDKTIGSKMIGKPLPAIALPAAVEGRPGLSLASYATGEPRLLNIFASWCVPCIAEAPQLMALKQRGVALDGIAIRDRPEDVAAFLRKWGDPYARIGADVKSSVQFALGSSGVPETFVIDGKGVIRHQHIGDIRPEHIPDLIARLEALR